MENKHMVMGGLWHRRSLESISTATQWYTVVADGHNHWLTDFWPGPLSALVKTNSRNWLPELIYTSTLLLVALISWLSPFETGQQQCNAEGGGPFTKVLIICSWIMFVCCLCVAPCKTCPTMQVVMCLSHDPSNHFSLSLKAGTVNAHNTWFLYLYFYFCFCICSFVFSEKPEEEREAVATWQRLWWSITLASLHRSNHWIYSFVRTVGGGDGDVDHGEDVDGRGDRFSSEFLNLGSEHGNLTKQWIHSFLRTDSTIAIKQEIKKLLWYQFSKFLLEFPKV